MVRPNVGSLRVKGFELFIPQIYIEFEENINRRQRFGQTNLFSQLNIGYE